MAKQLQVEAQTVQVVHNMSESEGENTETPRIMKKPRKAKLLEKPKSKSSKTSEDVLTDKASKSTLEGFQCEDLATFKRMYDDMVKMRDKTKELLLEAEKTRNSSQTTLLTPVAKDADSNWGQVYAGSEAYPGTQNPSAEFDPWQQTWFVDEEVDYDDEGEDDNCSTPSFNVEDQFAAMKMGLANELQGELMAKLELEKEKSLNKEVSLTQSGDLPVAVAQTTAMVTTDKTSNIDTSGDVQVSGKSKSETSKRTFKLDKNLKDGSLLSQLQEVYKKVKNPVAPRIVISESMAGAINFYYQGPKFLKTIREISREYTGLADVPGARVQALNEEIKFAESRKDGENSLLTATKGIVGALTAIAPVMDLILKRGSSDPELDAHGTDMLNAIRMLVATHCQIRIDRKLNVKKVVHSLLGKELIKEKRDIYGELPEPSDFLLGDNLGEKNRELMKSVRASENCMSSGLPYRGKRRMMSDPARGMNPFKFRGVGRFRPFRGARGASTWGQRQQPPEKKFGRSFEDYAQYGSIPSYHRGGRGRGAATRGFQK